LANLFKIIYVILKGFREKLLMWLKLFCC